MNAPDALARIVSLVAELTLRSYTEAPALTLDELAESHGVSPAQIARDLRTLTLLGEQSDRDWLLSLRVWQQGDRVSVSSQGAFRRPIRLTADEMLAVQVALVSVGELDLAARIGDVPRPPGAADGQSPTSHNVLETALQTAVANQRRVRVRYAAEGKDAPGERTVQPHQLVEYRNRVYLIAWCEDSGDWRRFRVDRILRFEIGGVFEPRPDYSPVLSADDVFQAGAVEEVVVRYRNGAARWARERFPRSETQKDGTVLVRFDVANPDWLVRTVLEVGSDAEIVEPIDYRKRLRDAVA